jgi:protein-tyrosine phosphatase
MNLLFVCTVNRMRSCTAESVYAADPRHRVRSAGTAPTATKQVTAELLRWADRIFVMEKMHEAFIIENFPDIDVSKKLIVLGIPDFYYYMEPELIEILRAKIDPLLKV